MNRNPKDLPPRPLSLSQSSSLQEKHAKDSLVGDLPRQKIQSRAFHSLKEWGSESLGRGVSEDSLRFWKSEIESERKGQAPSITVSSAPTPPTAGEEMKNPAPSEKRHPTPPEPLNLESLSWSIDLAHEERRLENNEAVGFTNSYNKQEQLKVRTREFTVELQKNFRKHVELFNQSRHSPAYMIHIYKIAGSDCDFMLYRNGVKLVISGQRAGRILFAFNQYLGQLFAPSQNPTLEIEAMWGPFDQLLWTFKGERIQTEDIVRYFLTEFVRQSFK